MSNDVENTSLLSDIVWTPERGEGEPEVRSIAWNQYLLGDEPYFGRRNTSSDVPVTPDTAILSSCVLACCRILSETISVLPLHVYRRLPGGDKEIAREIPLYKVLSFSPNSWQTKVEFFEQLMMNLCLWGNSYSQIISGRFGAVSELLNLHPSRMQVERLENGRLRYSYTNPETGRLERYTQDQIMHIRWTPEPDGIKGMVPVEVAREAIGLARAMEIHAGKFWANSARPGLVLQTDGSLSSEAAERLRDNWERLHRGADRSSRTAILTNGLKVESVGFSAEQSQFESSRRFQCEELARCYRIPMHLLQGGSVGNLEALGQEFVTYTLLPWVRRIETAISRSLIYNDDLFYAEFDLKGLMRGDSNSRMSFYTAALNAGLMTLNECRRAEGLPPIVSKEIPDIGDKHLIAMNLQPLEQALAPKPDPMAAMMGGGAGGPPAPAQGGVPSLPNVKTSQPPLPAEQGEKSEKRPVEVEAVEEKRAFCPTGEGGGLDNSCGSEDGDGSPDAKSSSSGAKSASPEASEGKQHSPDVTKDDNGDGVTDAARVGVPAMEVPPPPAVGRIPNLTEFERSVEISFISHFEQQPDEVASQFLSLVTKQDGPPTFGTDDAKCLTDVWSEEDPNVRAQNRATLNTCLHQTANAIAKRAFVKHLDTLKEGDEIMVTVGGCGAGKGFALKNVPQALEARGRAKAVWDSAGDQNATENPWILEEAQKRGLKVNYVYVHADPKVQWADPNRGVVKRASDPKDGRMVDAKVFADSYAIGARNHHAFHQANKDNPNASFTFLDNTGKPTTIDGVPREARELDADELASFAEREVERSQAPDHVKKGALIGRRIWGKGRKK